MTVFSPLDCDFRIECRDQALQFSFALLLVLQILSSGSNHAWCWPGSLQQQCRSRESTVITMCPIGSMNPRAGVLYLNNSVLDQLEASQASKYLPGQETSFCSPYLFFVVLQWIELSSYNRKQNLACHHHCFLSKCFKRIVTENPFGDCSEHREFLPDFWYTGAALELLFGDKQKFTRRVRQRPEILVYFVPNLCDLCK